MAQDKNDYSSPSEIGDHLKITYVPTYLLATAICLLIAAFIVWGFLGNVSDKAYYSGVIFPKEGTTDITLPNHGVVRNMLVHNGDSVHAGQTVAMVSVNGSYSFLSSTVNGLVISVKGDSEPFEGFEPIVSIVKKGAANRQTQLIAYADNDAQRHLCVGMEAQVWPANEKRDEIGYVYGRISRVVRYPAKLSKVREKLKSETLAKQLTGDGEDLVYEVQIDLRRAPDDSTGYDWSFGKPDDVSMEIGTYCSVLTETRRRSMFEYLFEASRTQIRNLQQKFE
jgi:hypothetical protein